MYCPDCGTEAGGAESCPECGADLRDARAAKAGGEAGADLSAGPQARTEPARGPSVRLLWFLVAVAAVAMVGFVLFRQVGTTPETMSGATFGDGAAATVEADTTGTYEELVERANGLYDQGSALFQGNDIDQGVAYFAAAAEVYAAAWNKQPGDPSVGTDWATSLFYSGDIAGAVKRITAVLEIEPGFQIGWFNKGNYLSHEALLLDQMGGSAEKVDALFIGARRAYGKAVALDPESDIGKEAASRLQGLPD